VPQKSDPTYYGQKMHQGSAKTPLVKKNRRAWELTHTVLETAMVSTKAGTTVKSWWTGGAQPFVSVARTKFGE
jgi:hypothetical protein